MSSKPSGVMEVTASEDEERMPSLDGIWETRGLQASVLATGASQESGESPEGQSQGRGTRSTRLGSGGKEMWLKL